MALPDIEVRSLTKSFPTSRGPLGVLEGLTFQVEQGSLLAIVGPSGCGKTTLLRILLGFEPPTAGEVWLRPARRDEGVAYVPQSALLLPWRTALQNVAVGIEVHSSIEPANMEFLDHLLRKYGLAGFAQAVPDELSGGMRQRLAVLRALARNPALLFCDEPFSSVDFVTRLDLNTQFKMMCRVEGITTVFVTHNIEEALFLGDVVLVLSGRPGRLVAEYRPSFSTGSEDAVKCREAPEFGELFRKIWNDLKAPGHRGK